MTHEKSHLRDLLRIVMVFMIIYYLPVANYIIPFGWDDISPGGVHLPQESMGGRESAVSMENVALSTEERLPEPEEFSRPRMLMYSSYTVRQGDSLSDIAKNFALKTGTLISLNDIKYPRSLSIGKVLRIPNQDGILHKVGKKDNLAAVSKKYKVDPDAVKTANELFSDKINENGSLFLPGGTIPWEDLQQINGDLFLWPVRGYISSYYGYRRSPFSGRRSFHGGLDIAAHQGTPIKAAMAGRVSSVGYDDIFGNFVVITHQSGYRTLYGHMSAIHTRAGVYVNAGDQIGDVGNTGQSTGPHLHFTVYKDRKTINPRTVIR